MPVEAGRSSAPTPAGPLRGRKCAARSYGEQCRRLPDPNGTSCAKTPLTKVPLCEARSSMSVEAAHRIAKVLARGMGITFYVVRSRSGRFMAVQIPSDGCQILATVAPPKGADDRLAA